jgi:DNA-binding LacI/PurR family transcriptional regulator
VFDTVKETGYRPNRLARGLVLQKTECLAVVIPDQRNPVYVELVHGIVTEAEKRGYEVFLCSTEDSVTREKEYLERLADRRCDGVILMPVHGALDKEVVGILRKEKIPWVNVGPPVAGIAGDYVFQHFDEGTYLITQHFLRLGRKRIVFLAAAVTREVAKPWVDGFRRALNEAGGNADAIRHCGPSMQDAYGAVKAIFSATHGAPDALVCLNDLSAIAACRAIEDCGLSISREVAVARPPRLRAFAPERLS